jgi:uncharacterized protein
MIVRALVLLGAGAIAMAAACSHSSAPGGAAETMPASQVIFAAADGEIAINVEIADDDAERSRGLMFRRELPERQGMLFVFPDEEEHPFWMKNTYVSLDMIFIDAGLKVVGVVANTEPLSTTSRTVGKPSKYVVEVLAGSAAKYGITEGTPLRLKLKKQER